MPSRAYSMKQGSYWRAEEWNFLEAQATNDPEFREFIAKKDFSHARAVFKAGPFVAIEKLGPPWGALARRMSKAMLGRA